MSLFVVTAPPAEANSRTDIHACYGSAAAQVYPFDPPAISSGTDAVAFTTAAALTQDDRNGALDVYLWSQSSHSYERVSKTGSRSHGEQASRRPAITADGRYVAFQSGVQMVPGDEDGTAPDVFVLDRKSGVTRHVSSGFDGTPTLGESSNASISNDGRFVAFVSASDNVVPKDTNKYADVFVRDMTTKKSVRVSVSSDGGEGDYISGDSYSGGVDISANGRFVAFASGAGNLVADDTDPFNWEVFVHDLQTGETERVAVSSEGAEADRPTLGPELGDFSMSPSISGDGRFVAFASSATNLVEGDDNNGGIDGGSITDVFIRDRAKRITERVSVSSDGAQGDGSSHAPSISEDGRFVAFSSRAGNLVAGDANKEVDIFVHDRGSRATTRMSVGFDGKDSLPGGSMSWGSLSPAMDPHGSRVAFASGATNLVTGDNNTAFDVFVGGRAGGAGLTRRSTPCNDGATPSPPPADRTASGALPATGQGAPLALTALLVLGGLWVVLQRRFRHVAAVLAVMLTASCVSSASAHHYSPIQPGAQVNKESDQCTMNFVFRGDNGDLFVGTAAHCVRRVAGADGAVGARMSAEGIGAFGTTVYGRKDLLGPARMDFVLIQVDRDKHHLVDPELRAWGGPTGVADEFVPGSRTFSYGFGSYLRNSEASRAKEGLLLDVPASGEWEGWNIDARAAIGGDSGSPVLDHEGQALGVATHLAAAMGQRGTVMGPTLELIMNELWLAGFELKLVTADFPAGPVDLIEHCASMPLDDSGRGDGCVRPTPGP